MAITKILHMKQAKSGYMAKHLANGLKYIMNPDKTENRSYVSGNNCIPENALEQMLDTKRHFGKMDKRQGYHFIISFEEEEVTEDTAFEIIGKFVKEYLGPDFEAVYAIHNDTDHIHGHIIFNSVRCTNGYKYDFPKGEWEYRIQPLVNRFCVEYGLSALDMEKVKDKRKRRQEDILERQEAKKRISKRNIRIKKDVDRAVEDADTYEEFLELLKCMGYELSGKKHLAVRENGTERSRRLDLLGNEYTEEMLRCRIAKPPVPIQQDNSRETELIYIFIPYRNRHLTRYQKECFIRKHRAGKIYTEQEPWKYRSTLQALCRLQEEYIFFERYGIRSKEDVYTVRDKAEGKIKEVLEKKRDFEEKKRSYEEVLQLLREIEPLEMEAGLYKDGYSEFLEEYQEYMDVCGKLDKLGYSLTDARKIEAYFSEGFQNLKEQRRQAMRDKQIACRLLNKVYQRESEKDVSSHIFQLEQELKEKTVGDQRKNR